MPKDDGLNSRQVQTGKQRKRLEDEFRQSTSLVQFFRESPLVGVELDLDRDREPSTGTEL